MLIVEISVNDWKFEWYNFCNKMVFSQKIGNLVK